MPRRSKGSRLGAVFGVAAAVMAALTAAPARAADLALPPDAQILKALQAKRLLRCPRVETRPHCGGARLHDRHRTLS